MAAGTTRHLTGRHRTCTRSSSSNQPRPRTEHTGRGFCGECVRGGSRGRAAAYANALRAVTCPCPETCTGQQRRARHGGLISRVDGTVAYGPVWDWHTDEIWGHISRHRLPVNPVYDSLRRLGAPEHFLRVSGMIDGTRPRGGPITWLRRGWPALFEEPLRGPAPIREFV